MLGKPYMVGSPHTWWPGQPAGQLWWGAMLGRLVPTKAGRLAGRPPCMWAAHHVYGLFKKWYILGKMTVFSYNFVN